MASLIRSANTAGSDIFNAIGTTARMTGNLVNSASYAVDTLELKSKELYDSTATGIATRRTIAQQRAIVEATDDHVDFLMESFKRRNLGDAIDFPYQQIWDKVYASIEASVKGEGTPAVLTLEDVFPTKASKLHAA